MDSALSPDSKPVGDLSKTQALLLEKVMVTAPEKQKRIWIKSKPHLIEKIEKLLGYKLKL